MRDMTETSKMCTVENKPQRDQNLLKVFFNFMCISVFTACMYVYQVCAWSLCRSEEGMDP